MTRRQYYERIKQLGLIPNSNMQEYRLGLIEQIPVLSRTNRTILKK